MAREMNVVAYDPNWPALYNQEKAALEDVLGELMIGIQHFGSTAIPGMSAKPTIDVMVLVQEIKAVDTYDEAMIQAGYEPRGEAKIPGRRFFRRFEADGENHAAHIHVYEPDNAHVKRELMFRDYLMIDNEAFRQYEHMKLEASERFRFSPKEYTDAKTECITEIMAKAREFYQAQPVGAAICRPQSL